MNEDMVTTCVIYITAILIGYQHFASTTAFNEQGEIFKKCGDAFIRTCSEPNDKVKIDSRICGPSGWYCRDGYVRDHTYRCVSLSSCGCREDEILIRCGIKCANTVDDYSDAQMCSYECECTPGSVKVDGICRKLLITEKRYISKTKCVKKYIEYLPKKQSLHRISNEELNDVEDNLNNNIKQPQQYLQISTDDQGNLRTISKNDLPHAIPLSIGRKYSASSKSRTYTAAECAQLLSLKTDIQHSSFPSSTSVYLQKVLKLTNKDNCISTTARPLFQDEGVTTECSPREEEVQDELTTAPADECPSIELLLPLLLASSIPSPALQINKELGEKKTLSNCKTKCKLTKIEHVD